MFQPAERSRYRAEQLCSRREQWPPFEIFLRVAGSFLQMTCVRPERMPPPTTRAIRPSRFGPPLAARAHCRNFCSGTERPHRVRCFADRSAATSHPLPTVPTRALWPVGAHTIPDTPRSPLAGCFPLWALRCGRAVDTPTISPKKGFRLPLADDQSTARVPAGFAPAASRDRSCSATPDVGSAVSRPGPVMGDGLARYPPVMGPATRLRPRLGTIV